MKFTYSRYEINPTRTNPAGIVYRPEVLLRVIGKSSDAFLLALVDTGADESVLPLSLAEEIGAELHPHNAIRAAGVGGSPLDLIPGDVDLEITWSGPPIRWRACIGFASFLSPEEECAIIGHVGALEFFTTSLFGDLHCGTLEPNAAFPAAT